MQKTPATQVRSRFASLVRPYTRSHFWPAALVIALVMLCYAPLLFYRYAFSDDYAYLVIRAYRAVNPYFLGDGRPLGGLMAHLFYSFVRQVPDAWILRLLALIQLAIVLLLIQRAATMNGLNTAIAALLAVGFAIVAPIQNWVVWGVSSWQLPALVASVGSYFWARNVVDNDGIISVKNIAILFFISFVALSIYQPFATAISALVLLEFVANSERPFRDKRLAVFLAAYVAAMTFYFLIFKFVYLLYVPLERQYRISLVSIEKLPAKLEWFWNGPILDSFAPGFTYAPHWLSLSMMGLSAIGLWLWCKSKSRFAVVVLVAGAMLVLSHVHSLVPAEATLTRAQVSIALVGLVLICLACQALARAFDISHHSQVAVIAIITPVLLASSGWRVVAVNARPQTIEFARIEAMLEATRLPPKGPLLVIGLPEGTSLTGSYCDYAAMIGCVSSSWQFGLPNMVRLWMRSRHINYDLYQIYYVRSEKDTVAARFEPDVTTYGPIPQDAFVLDFRQAIMRPL